MSRPTVRAALLCERVVVEPDGVRSAIRIFDEITAAPGASIDATLLFLLAGVERRDTPHELLLEIAAPSGTIGRQRIAVAAGPDAGAGFNLVMPLRLEAGQPGTYWIVLGWNNEEPLARVPIHFRAPDPQLFGSPADK